MSITRGAEVFHMKVGLDITYQPTSVKWDTEQVVITIKYYACSVAWTFNDPQDMDHLGAYVGNTGYTMVSAVGQSKDQLVKTITKTVVPGASVQTFNYRGTINGIYAGSEYHPTHVRTATVAALPPAPTSPPSASVSWYWPTELYRSSTKPGGLTLVVNGVPPDQGPQPEELCARTRVKYVVEGRQFSMRYSSPGNCAVSTVDENASDVEVCCSYRSMDEEPPSGGTMVASAPE